MNLIISILEAMDGKILPPLLLALILALLAYSGYKTWLNHTENDSMDSNNKNSQRSTSVQSHLQSEWRALRNYVDTMKSGPTRSGIFTGWFQDEHKGCTTSWHKQQDITQQLKMETAGKGDYPKHALDYLRISEESNRKPDTRWIFIPLGVLAVAEAYGFSQLFADLISTASSTASDVNKLAAAIVVLVSFVLVFSAHRYGMALYKQGYARSAHLRAPNGLKRSRNELINHKEDQNIDKDEPISTRIINRSNFVQEALAARGGSSDSKQNRDSAEASLIPRYSRGFRNYLIALVAVGLLIGTVRVYQIEQDFRKQLKSELARQSAQEEFAAPTTSAAAKPPGIADDVKEMGKIITQEELEGDKRGKMLGVLIYVVLFYAVQAIAVLISSARGFASEYGESAYADVLRFRKRFGDLSLDQYLARLEQDIAQVGRVAQEELHAWQLGLQTEFSRLKGTMGVHDLPFFQSCMDAAGDRTYSRFCKIADAHGSAHEYSSAPLPARIELALASVTPSPAPIHASPAPITTLPPAVPAETDPEVEFYIKTLDGGETEQVAPLLEFKRQAADGELDIARLMARKSGTREKYMPYSEFIRSLRAPQ